MNKYIAYYKGNKYEVEAETTYEAQQKLATELKVKKSYLIQPVLAEKDGVPVVHTPDF